MSRWIQQFEEHPFQGIWKKTLEVTKIISVDDETIVTSAQEVARLVKAITFIDNLLKACDPELIPPSTWTNFQPQLTASLAQINQYQQNRNITHITKANSHIDNLLTYIRPYVVSSGKAAQSASASLVAYTTLINSHISNLEDKIRPILSEVKEQREQVLSDASKIADSKASIEVFESQLFEDSEEKLCLKNSFDQLLDLVEEGYDKIAQFNHKLNVGDQDKNEEAIVKQIEMARNNVTQSEEHIESMRNASANTLGKLYKFSNEIFGTIDEQGDLVKVGLKQELDTRLEELETFKLNQETRYKTLNKEIESLIPGATSAGLATAYYELKNSFDSPIAFYSKMFYAAVFGLFVAALITVTDKVGLVFVEFVDLTDISKVLTSFAFKLPLILPILWLAIFASKRRSESLRLQQEYAHKEALAKSYQSFKIQIKELGEEDSALMTRLLVSAIESVSFNASTTLDKAHGDKMPVHAVIDKLLEKIPSTGTS